MRHPLRILVVALLASGVARAVEAPPASAEAPAPRAATAPEKAVKAPKVAAKPAAVDRLELDRTEISGNRELPKVMVIVPWKHADVGELAGRPASSLMDEVLKPLDRDVLRRELNYYEAVGRASSAGSTAAASRSSKGEN
jgi:predicted lipid-binding transport protein (Tim44 family)